MKSTTRIAITLALSLSLALGMVLAFGASNVSKPAPTGRQVIVTVDLKTILMDSLPGKAAQVRFRDEVMEAKARVDEKTAHLQNLEKEMSSVEFLTLNEADSRAQRREYEKEKLELEFLVEETEKQLKSSQEKVMAALTEQIKSIIDRVAKDKGYDLVLIASEARMLYSSGLTDASSEILAAFESEWLKKVPQGNAPE